MNVCVCFWQFFVCDHLCVCVCACVCECLLVPLVKCVYISVCVHVSVSVSMVACTFLSGVDNAVVQLRKSFPESCRNHA